MRHRFFAVLALAPPPNLFGIDPGQFAMTGAIALLTALFGQIGTWYTQLTTWATSENFVLTTGMGVSYGQTTVIMFWGRNVLVADASLAIFIVWIAYHVMLGNHNPIRMLPRVVLSVVAVHASLFFIGLFIELNNALCQSVLQQTAANPGSADIAGMLIRVPPPNTATMIASLFQQILVQLMGATIIVEMFGRLAVLDVIIVLSPLLLLLYITPETQMWANIGSTAFFATVFMQFLTDTVLELGSSLITQIATSSIVSTLVGIAVLMLTITIPRWLGSAVLSSSVSSVRSSSYALYDFIRG